MKRQIISRPPILILFDISTILIVHHGWLAIQRCDLHLPRFIGMYAHRVIPHDSSRIRCRTPESAHARFVALSIQQTTFVSCAPTPTT